MARRAINVCNDKINTNLKILLKAKTNNIYVSDLPTYHKFSSDPKDFIEYPEFLVLFSGLPASMSIMKISSMATIPTASYLL